MADIENMRKRHTVELENAHKFSIGSFAKELLEVADNLERAIELVPDSVRTGDENPMMKALYEGVKLTDDQLVKSFASVGIARVNPASEKFDPNLHEALFKVPDATKEPNTVAQVMSVGYKLHERCLRSAKVGVFTKPE
jgi:molecular chaperone GrpE